MNLFTLLEMAADAMGDRIAISHGERDLSYAELVAAARRAAAQVRAAGATRLAYLAVNGPAAPAALFGAALAGVPYVPINYRLTDAEIAALLARIPGALLVSDVEVPGWASTSDGDPGVTIVSVQAFLAETLLYEGDAPDDDRSIAVELFTSGTTGAPKAAILRHDNLMSYILGSVDFRGAEADDAAIVTVPPYHVAGISAVLSSVYAGRRMVQLPAFDPADWLTLAARHRISNAFLVPTMLQRLVEYLGDAPPTLPALRALAYGGGRMPPAIVERAMDLLPHVDFTNAYGLTETSSTIALLEPDDHRAARASNDPAVRARLGSVGRALPTLEIAIRDEAGTVLPPGEAGLVFVRGPQVAGEYHGLGSLLDAEGWFPTRDRGWLDDAGYLFLDGRADDVIVRGGENISPGEIEAVLAAHPHVRDVAVVAMPDEQWGEAVAAVVVLAPGSMVTAEALQALVRDRLRSSRVPALVRFVDMLPYNETGKLLRRVVRDALA